MAIDRWREFILLIAFEEGEMHWRSRTLSTDTDAVLLAQRAQFFCERLDLL